MTDNMVYCAVKYANITVIVVLIKAWKVNFSVLHVRKKFIAFGRIGEPIFRASLH